MAGDAGAPEPGFDLPVSGCLDFLWPAIPERLVGKAEREWIEGAAAQLPPIPRVALELRLAAEEPGVDLHQHISAAGADAAILKRYLSSAAGGPFADAALRGFLSDWADNADGLRGDLGRLYLEWDRPPAGGSPAAPGIFLPVERVGDSAVERTRRRTVGLASAERLQPGAGEAVGAALRMLSPLLPPGVSLNYLGLMIGRGPVFRVNLRGIRRPDLASVLEATGWTGDRPAALRHFERLVDRCDRVIVALDFAPTLHPTIGFEAILDRPPQTDRRWRALFDHIVEEGLCDAEKRRALEALPENLFPETNGQPWPASWLIPAVLSPKRFVPRIERRISHVKLSIGSDGSASAKAYVSAEHHWSRAEASPPARHFGAPPSPDAGLADASHRAIGFLAGAIGQDDLWRDFSMPGASDEWVTAFVGWALAGIDDERARFAVRNSLVALLRRQREEGGWAYNAECPPDADSTAWALKFLDAAGYAGPAADKAKTFLLSHGLRGGGFSTYRAAAQVRFEDRIWDGPSEGWRSAHLCVAANAAAILPEALAPLLLAGQSGDGSWQSYWWRKDVFSTALAVEALAGDRKAADARARALAWARRQVPLPASTFDRAWLARMLSQGDARDREAARLLLARLVQEQSADGGWPAGAELLLPHPSQVRRDDRQTPYLDVRRLMTTASVLAAIMALEAVR